jgi:hypothetical protein
VGDGRSRLGWGGCDVEAREARMTAWHHDWGK